MRTAFDPEEIVEMAEEASAQADALGQAIFEERPYWHLYDRFEDLQAETRHLGKAVRDLSERLADANQNVEDIADLVRDYERDVIDLDELVARVTYIADREHA